MNYNAINLDKNNNKSKTSRNCELFGNLFDNLWKIGCCTSKRKVRIYNSHDDFEWVGLGVRFPRNESINDKS